MTSTPIDQSTPSRELVWVAPRTFFGAPSVRDLGDLDARVAFLGVPYDAGTPQPGNRTGQAAGPSAARLSSWEQFDYGAASAGGAEGWYDVETDRDQLVGVTMADAGDVAIQGSEVDRNFDRISEAIRRLAGRGCLVVAVGGDHSISFPLVRGFDAVGKLDVVHVDAHADFPRRSRRRPPHRREPAAADVRAAVRRDAQPARPAQRPAGRGRRSTRLRGSVGDEPRAGGRPHRGGPPRRPRVGRALRFHRPRRARPLARPGATLPEPGGPSYRQVREALAEIARAGRVVGFDIAELNPPNDPSAASARVATWLITHFLSAIFDERAARE